jgi:hypothetical protein
MAAGKAAKQPPVPLGRLIANRDWILLIECRNDGVVLKYGNQKYSLAELSAKSKGEHPLVATVRQVIARRQATVVPGEPPWRPMLRFQVERDGMPAYYMAYPLLDALHLPMSQETVER